MHWRDELIVDQDFTPILSSGIKNRTRVVGLAPRIEGQPSRRMPPYPTTWACLTCVTSLQTGLQPFLALAKPWHLLRAYPEPFLAHVKGRISMCPAPLACAADLALGARHRQESTNRMLHRIPCNKSPQGVIVSTHSRSGHYQPFHSPLYPLLHYPLPNIPLLSKRGTQRQCRCPSSSPG